MMRSAKRVLLLAAAVLLSAAAFAKAAPHHEKREGENPGGIPLSKETRRLAAECRRDPSDGKREALKRQVRDDYDRHVSKLRNQPKSNKKRHEQHRRIEALIRDRDRKVDEIVDRLLSGPPEKENKPRPPRKKR